MDSPMLRTERDTNDWFSCKQSSLMNSSGNNLPENWGSCGRIQLTRGLRNCSIPVMSRYNEQMTMFSGRRTSWTTLCRFPLDGFCVLELPQFNTTLGIISNSVQIWIWDWRASSLSAIQFLIPPKKKKRW
ncbi:hypothetical protein TNCV_3684771 [Trichonephila clavipes]|uniref:Uncharacterized protein n=1 Tax=Trichonephila clavipes TaxID=2585209 RepID=A0A8X6RJP5_TRICX|nr:hypothetical protein TNCV_3684771 [Trichonephila clavipes]